LALSLIISNLLKPKLIYETVIWSTILFSFKIQLALLLQFINIALIFKDAFCDVGTF